jgi:CDP-diacylglycerol--glycerol-3-phosphate 3-phosphatidyltransferase
VTTEAKKKPLISANMVTTVRLLPMPLLCWLVYEGSKGNDNLLWIAMVLGTIIGCTDFVDGYLARKHGPTVLGGLLDPIADKVFIAFAYLPFADLGIIPWWAVALMFVREFLVTGLRSVYEKRGMSMKTSYLGKVKTWTQMQGLGMFLLFMLLVPHRDVMWGLLIAGMVIPPLAAAALWFARKKFWMGAVVMWASFVVLAYLHYNNDLEFTMEFIMLTVVGITWLSGFDYVAAAFTQLRGRGDFSRFDAVRIVGALAMPILAFAAIIYTPMPWWPIAAILACELAVGGLDNLLAHHDAAASAAPWGTRVLGISILLGAALLLTDQGYPGSAEWLGMAGAALSIIGVAVIFYQGRDYYLDQSLRGKEMRESLATDGA